jgi:hypothetical protein
MWEDNIKIEFKVAGSYDHGNELQGSTGGEFLADLSDYQLLKKGRALW